MQKRNSERLASALVAYLALSLLIAMHLASPAPAQTAVEEENIQLPWQQLADGIPTEITGRELNTSGIYLVFSDSSQHPLALLSLRLNGNQVLLKQSTEIPQAPNVVHWHYDENAALLVIDLRGIRGGFSPASRLQVTILPQNTRQNHLKITLREGEAVGQPEALTVLKVLNVDIN